MDSPAGVGRDRTVTPAHADPAATSAAQAAGTVGETLGAQLRNVMLDGAAQHVDPLISAATAMAAAYPVQETGLAGRTAQVRPSGSGAAAAGVRPAMPASERDLADEMLRMVSPFPMALLGVHGPVDGTRHVPVRAIQEALRRLGERHPDAAASALPASRAAGPAALWQSLAPAQIAPLGAVCEIRPRFAADGVGNGFDTVARERFPVALGRLSTGPYPLDFDAASPSQGGVRFVAGFPVGTPQDYGGYRLDPGFAAEAADLALTFPDSAAVAAARPAGAGEAAAFSAPLPLLPPVAGAGSRPVNAAQAAVFARLYQACRADHAMMTAVSGLLGVTKAIYGLVASTCDVFRASDDVDEECDLFFVEQEQYLRLAQHPSFAFEVAGGAGQDMEVRIRAVYPVAGYRGEPEARWRVARGAGESHVTFATSFSIRRAASHAAPSGATQRTTQRAAQRPAERPAERDAAAQRETAQWLDRLFAGDAGIPDARARGDQPERILAVRGATTISVAIENQWRFDPVSGDCMP
ncbi:hypothetical protein OVY01_08440 [Robbsia sp. Bb-Pol-6]|uniref:Uncharacterized protein n=1 Tax=Robbsia betulipollinis TaxID=2981849 RepID=A0ABT3ZL42_9BURK|nr:hypothetical protein [Robbsia betulipollinis]MCY0387261.1 hypothetical protein [Robbsia betulipollinis]